uniref:Conjugal transfer protein TrbI n=1 Tax=Globodera pallida TaxID=36090 RepID=A0A183CSZ2_GLOPA
TPPRADIYGPGSKNTGLASTNLPQQFAELTPQQQQQER